MDIKELQEQNTKLIKAYTEISKAYDQLLENVVEEIKQFCINLPIIEEDGDEDYICQASLFHFLDRIVENKKIR